MFACALTLLLLLPVIFAAAALENHISTNELTEMGVRLENSNF
jgi:hypothetical protein